MSARRTRGLVIGLAGLVAFAGLLWGVGPRAAPALDGLARTRLGPGLELVRADVRRGRRRVASFAAVYAEPDRVELAIVLNQARANVAVSDPSALLAVNGGYFTADFRPTGLLLSGGQVHSRFVPEGGSGGSGVFTVGPGGAELLERQAVRARGHGDATFAIQSGPRILEPGGAPGIRSDDGASANRTVIARDRGGRVVLLVIHGADGGLTDGPTLFEVQGLLAGLAEEDPSLALDAALNLDGGPSTGLWLREPSVSLPEGTPVHSVITLKPRP